MSTVQKNFPIGTIVVVIGNSPYSKEDPNKIVTGIVIGYYKGLVVYQDYSNGDKKEYIAFGSVLYWSQDLIRALEKLTWDERWNIVSKGLTCISKEDAIRKEKDMK